jgi:hypothetical protein
LVALPWFKLWYLTLREEHKISTVAKQSTQKMFAPDINEMSEQFRMIHEERNSYRPPAIVRIVKS